jgi:hypothetical protein
MLRRLSVFIALTAFIVPFTAVAQEELDASFVAADDSYGFDYPSSWDVLDLEETNSALLTNEDATVGGFVFGPRGMEDLVGVDPDSDLDEALEAVVDFLGGDIGDAEELEIGDREAAFAEFEEQDVDGLAYVIRMSDDTMGAIRVTLQRGAPDDIEETLLAMLETLDVLEAPENNGGGDVLVFAGDDFAFSYPESWELTENRDGSVAVSNTDDALDIEDLPDEGYVLVLVYGPAAVEDIADSDDPDDIIEAFMDEFGFDYEDPEEVELDDRVLVAAVLDESDIEGAGFVVEFSDGQFGFVLALAAEGEFTDYSDDVSLIIASLDSAAAVVEGPTGEFPETLDDFDAGMEDTIAQLEGLGVIPTGGEEGFEQDEVVQEGRGYFYASMGDGFENTSYILSGTLEFEIGDEDELEICSFSTRIQDTGDLVLFTDVGMTNYGSVFLLDRFDEDEDAYVEETDDFLDVDDAHHFLIITVQDEITVYVDGELIFERSPVVPREGTFGVAMSAARNSASCTGTDIWVYDLDNADFPEEPEEPETGGEACLVTPIDSNVNVRSGPGTEFEVEGTLEVGEEVVADGQAVGALGAVWWHLEDGGWVRYDLVDETGPCDDLPQVEP